MSWVFDSRGARRPRANVDAMQRYLIISGHDFRTPRWANMHFIARELAKRGTVRFFSLGFSLLSHFNGDPRLPILQRANRIEEFQGVQCFLWKSAWHPFNLRRPALRGLSRMLFKAYRRRMPDVFRSWVEDSDVIIVESGMSPILMPIIHRLNPRARKIYIASDLLHTIGVDPYVSAELDAWIDRFDTVIVPSPMMIPAFPASAKTRFVPHGLDLAQATVGASPYTGGNHAVSVGSMLFDRSFFELAAPNFPQVTFHVVGGGSAARHLTHANVKVYGEMPYERTLAYIKYADFGIAPYNAEGAQAYLCDTSMKLMQYAYFGIPAVCPEVAVGGHAGRFGYVPGEPASIAQAICGALAAGRFKPPPMLSWSEVTERIIDPQDRAEAAGIGVHRRMAALSAQG
jgi:2-beta-glucuronyltransferase